MVEKDADCMKKDPEINAGSPEMGGSRDELEELTQLMRDAKAEDFVDTLLKQDIRCTRDLADFTMRELHECLQIPFGTAKRMVKMAQAAPQEPSPPRSAIRRSPSASEQAERDLAEQAEREIAEADDRAHMERLNMQHARIFNEDLRLNDERKRRGLPQDESRRHVSALL